MQLLTLILTSLACLLLGAHALRTGELGLAVAWVALVGLLPMRRAWLRIVLVAALAWGAWSWLLVGRQLVEMRLAFGMPWLRLAMIMAVVTGLTLAAAGLLHGRHGRAFFHRHAQSPSAVAAMVVLVTATLGLLHTRVPLTLLLAERYFPGWGWLEILFLGLYTAWVGEGMLDPGLAPKVRPRIWGLFSLVFFTQLGLGLLGMDRMLMTGDLHLPVPALIVAGPLFRGHGLFMPILFLSTVALVGPAWCSHLCYIGAWDDRASRLRHKRPVASLPAWAFRLRWALFVLTPVAALAGRFTGLSTAAALGLAALFGLVGVGVMAWLSRRMGLMVHCAAYCPIGLLGNLLGRLTPWRLAIEAGCTRCGSCSRVCRYNALTADHLERGRPGLSCTLCGDCLGACPRQEIGYRFLGLSPRSARTLFVVLAVSLHTVFLAVARI